MGRGLEYGPGIGFGGGMGRGATPSPAVPAAAEPPADAEKVNLERRAEALEAELKQVRERLGSLENA
jgi:hypothetical protein